MKAAMFFFAVGMLVTFGAIGTIDVDPNANVPFQAGIATMGLAIMYRCIQTLKGIK